MYIHIWIKNSIFYNIVIKWKYIFYFSVVFVPNSSKPPSKKAVVEWFRAKEIPRRAGFEKDKNAIATWFHGIL